MWSLRLKPSAKRRILSLLQRNSECAESLEVPFFRAKPHSGRLVLPYVSNVGMLRGKGHGFLGSLASNWVSILPLFGSVIPVRSLDRVLFVLHVTKIAVRKPFL